jgi:S1-C subfamily serine protease
MAEPNPLIAFSDHLAQLVERTAGSVVAVRQPDGRSSSGIHWRSGVIVTAEEVLEHDKDITLTLPGGGKVAATLAGRDPSTDVAVLRCPHDGLVPAATADVSSLRAGHVVLAVGSHDGAALAGSGIVAYVGSAWRSQRGGTIDSLIRLDLRLNPAAEGGALVDVHGKILGMVVSGPRRRVLAIPGSTIDRAVDAILAKGYVGRGYLGAGLQPVRSGKQAAAPGSAGSLRGVLVVNVDPDGPAARAGLLIGDIVTGWNGKPIDRVREVMRHLGSDSVGSTVDLALLRGGAPAGLKIVVGERPIT